MTECLQALLVHFFHRCDSTQALRGLAERARKALRIRSRSLKPVARAISSSDSERLSLEPNARRFDPELCDDLGRRAAGFLGENSRELARARVRLLRKLLDRQGLVEMFPREGDRLGHSIGAGIHLQRRGELRLRTGSTMIHDEVLRDSLGDVFSVTSGRDARFCFRRPPPVSRYDFPLVSLIGFTGERLPSGFRC